MTTSDKPREVPCPCGRDRVAMTKDGNYRRHVPYLRRYNVCLGGKPVPAETLAKADARDVERAEQRRYDGLAHDVRAAEWDYAHAVKAQTEAIAAVTRANTARDAAWQRLTDTRNALAEADAQRAASAPATPDDEEASDDKPRDPLKCPQCGGVYEGSHWTSHKMSCGIGETASLRAYAFGHVGRSDTYAVAVRAYVEAVEAFSDRSSA